jgi:hypothetical protein
MKVKVSFAATGQLAAVEKVAAGRVRGLTSVKRDRNAPGFSSYFWYRSCPSPRS